MPDDLLEKEEVISYERLYRLWELNNWSATEINFDKDLDHWRNRFDDKQRAAALWNYAMFLVGEEAVARTLSPVLDAAPTHAQSLFLTTQIVDEARHHVFFDRFVREVAGRGRDTASTLRDVESQLTWGFKQIFAELDRLSDELARKPKDRPLLAQMIALYHMVIEGMLAVPGQHFIQRYVKELDLMPGFSEGITNVSRDEARHVAFGIRFLGELIRESKENKAAAIELFDRVLPWAAGVFIPPGGDRSYAECFGFSLVDIYAFGLRSFNTKLKRLGIDPDEISILSRQDPNDSFEERSRQAWVLIDAGVIGDDRREPKMTPEAMEVLFAGVARAMRLKVARSIGSRYQWEFTDTQPWHITVNGGDAEAAPGRLDNYDVCFRTSASDWAKIAVGRLDPRRAVLSRKLRLRAPLRSKVRLPQLFR
jgi:Ribonucleotide reductase, small chain/SCP-2 sterol transfer family